MTAAIAIRNTTKDRLQAIVRKATESQQEVDVSLSDVIDGLLIVTEDLTGEEEVLEQVLNVAAKN